MTDVALSSRRKSLIANSSGGVSKESQFLDSCSESIFGKSDKSINGLYVNEIKESLTEIFEECSMPDWDGYGANAVSLETLLEAFDFLDKMPRYFPIPEICVEPSGEIGFNWHRDNRTTFLIGFDGRQTIAYAGIFGNNTVQGTEYFGDMIPDAIIANIRRLYF